MHSYIVLSLIAIVSQALAAIINVNAGQHGLSYEPDTVTAAVGDELHIHFYPGSHTFSESTFADPCALVANGINSGTINSNSGQASQMFVVKINDTDPHWMYCAAPGHCGAGMALVVNPPAGGNTLKDYQTAASGKGGSGSSTVSGGFLAANVDTNDDNSSSSISAATSALSTSARSTATATGTSASATNTGLYSQPQATGNAAPILEVGAVMMLAPVAAYVFS